MEGQPRPSPCPTSIALHPRVWSLSNRLCPSAQTAPSIGSVTITQVPTSQNAYPTPNSRQRTRVLSVSGEPFHRRGPGPGSQPPAYPLLRFWASDQGRGASSHLCSLEHCEPLKAFVGGVRGAAATIARPGSSLSGILWRERVGCGVILPGSQAISHLTAHRDTRPSSNPPASCKKLEAPKVLWWPPSLSCCPSRRMTIFMSVLSLSGKDMESHSPGLLCPECWRASYSGEGASERLRAVGEAGQEGLEHSLLMS